MMRLPGVRSSKKFLFVILVFLVFSSCASTPKVTGEVGRKAGSMVRITRWLFDLFPYTMDKNYRQYREQVEVIKDIDYRSDYPNGYLDIIRPKEIDGSEKLIFFVHGGGFIAGDKKDVEHYFVHLANDGFVTVNINYALAPEQATYPMPVKQLEEAYTFIKNHAEEYRLNMDQVYFGGDSAGGHIAAQFVTTQTNDEYLTQINASTFIRFEKVVEPSTLKGALFFCAVFDISQMLNPPPHSMLLPMRDIGEAYFGTADLTASYVNLAGVINRVDKNYPPVFITDGNDNSIEWEAKEFVQVLTSLGVETEGVFFDRKKVRLGHEYQFNMNKPYAQQTYKKVVEFLKK
jgi:acetyl esterase/lipase